MNFIKLTSLTALTVVSVWMLPACKAKKELAKPTPPPAAAAPSAPPAQEATETVKSEPAEQATTPAPPDYNFSNIQFEYDSGVLKTDSYPILEKASAEMKKDESVSFLLAGHSSAEGNDEHNMSLSTQRANSVKTFLVNSGIAADRLLVKGFGESKPVADNTSEAGRMKNRRVEIKKQN
ncbi:OmpA family protein [Pedobacter sp. HMF7647]|uniref:OmpA family protein n=1 Tax=Hufsiella arboris TaxID=2695275 RepID=A0A7K1YDG5_9SPHI|nr:OmpA family protein [Hufsiella arboris]MXV52635.1 OmpA family protein [Hufsiella arboris]